MKVKGILAPVAVVVGLAVAAPAASAATIKVNDNLLPATCVGAFPTIQQGVSAAVSGDTVLVCPGYYNESVTVTTANLIIKGLNLPPDLTCGATRTAVNTAVFLNRPYSVVQGAGTSSFSVYANGVTIDRFVIQGPNGGSDFGIYTDAGTGGYLIQNNLIQDNAGGLLFNTDGSAQSKAIRNCFRQNNDSGSGSGDAIFAYDVTNELVQGNRSYGNSYSSGVFTSAVSGLTVQGNITKNDAGGYSIDNSDTSSITGNIMSGSTSQEMCVGPQNTGLVVQGNILKLGLGFGILFDFCDGAGSANTGLTVSGNIVTSTDSAFLVNQDDMLQSSTIRGNIVKSTSGTGAWVKGTLLNGGNTFTGNIAKGGVGFYGCRDDTLGGGTAGTANTWGDSNIGKPNNLPAALCFPHI